MVFTDYTDGGFRIDSNSQEEMRFHFCKHCRQDAKKQSAVNSKLKIYVRLEMVEEFRNWKSTFVNVIDKEDKESFSRYVGLLTNVWITFDRVLVCNVTVNSAYCVTLLLNAQMLIKFRSYVCNFIVVLCYIFFFTFN